MHVIIDFMLVLIGSFFAFSRRAWYAKAGHSAPPGHIKGGCGMPDRARGIIQKLRAMAGLVAKSARVDPYTIAYLEAGRGEPVLLAHGFGADKDM